MEKTLQIDGKQVRFKSTAGTARRYRNQFGKDFFAALFEMMPLIEAAQKKDEETGAPAIDGYTVEQVKALNFEVFENIIWVMAKTADPSIPEPEEWMDQFEEMPIQEIMPELQDMMMASFGTQSKKNHPALKRNR